MKKTLLTLLAILPLASCGVAEAKVAEFTVGQWEGPPAVKRGDSEYVTYLMMSPFGSLNIEGAPVKGKVSELFYENTIAWLADAGTALPTAEQVVSSVNGATFRGWAYYDEENDNVFPDYYTTVPTKEGLALKAIFDGTDAGGNSGASTDSSVPAADTGFGLIFGDGTKVKGTAAGTDHNGRTQYLVSNQAFVKDQEFALYDFEKQTSWIIAIDSASFGGASSEYVSVIEASQQWKVLKDFTADVYIKLKYQDDQIYFGLK